MNKIDRQERCLLFRTFLGEADFVWGSFLHPRRRSHKETTPITSSLFGVHSCQRGCRSRPANHLYLQLSSYQRFWDSQHYHHHHFNEYNSYLIQVYFLSNNLWLPVLGIFFWVTVFTFFKELKFYETMPTSKELDSDFQQQPEKSYIFNVTTWWNVCRFL